jgi:DNA repair exonuclease SbcCD ATPase subunit
MSEAASENSGALLSPAVQRQRLTGLARDRQRNQEELTVVEQKLKSAGDYLEVAPKVEAALKSISEALFDQHLRVIENNLSNALQEVLQQPIRLKAEPSFKRSAVTVDFYIERAGEHEDVMRGQGGSVANVLSVGLRLYALTTLDRKIHRPFLVLDEQDCWLRAELVPRLVKIIHAAGKQLKLQVLLISHFDVSAFEAYADRIYQFAPQPDGSVKAELRQASPSVIDRD